MVSLPCESFRLVATLGSKSSLRAVTRRKILDVDVHRACDTIRNPQSPLALRLQGNLLYGVARVYSQQCDYVLGDAQAMRDKVRGASIVIKELALDPEGIRPDQLNLPDDPAFAPDFDLSIDLSAFDHLPTEANGRASLLSPPSLISSRSSQHNMEGNEEMGEPGLEPPSADTSLGARLPGLGPGYGGDPGMTSFDRPSGMSFLGDESGIVDVGWEFDEHGDMIETAQAPKSPTIIGTAGDVQTTGLTPDTAISARVRREHAEGLQMGQPARSGQYLEEGMLGLGEDDLLFAEARPFSPRHGAEHDATAQPPVSTSPSQLWEEEGTSTALSAPQRRIAATKPIEPDSSTGLTNRQLRQWDERYVGNMQAAATAKIPYKAAQQAKKNAKHWVLGQGIGDVGSGIGQGHAAWAPLHLFSGENLLAALTGIQLSPTGRKHERSRSMTGTADEGERRVRAREGQDDEDIEQGAPGQNPTLPGQEEGGIFVGDDDMDVEVGRIAAEELPERLSSQMPWDIYSASRHGSVRVLEGGTTVGIASSVGGPGHGFELGPPSALSRQRGSRRLTSASPLQGRGPLVPLSQRISIVSSITEGDMLGTTGGGHSGGEDEFMGSKLPAASDAMNPLAAAALDSESRNFLDYLDAQIHIARDVTPGEVEREEEHEGSDSWPATTTTSFETLIPPIDNTKMVAAQAFLHILTLASKNLVRARQRESFADIELAVAVQA